MFVYASYTGKLNIASLKTLFSLPPTDSAVITFNKKTPLRVKVVRTPQDLQRGLSGVPRLEATEGMLFIFPEDGFHGIWMKDMQFPIDITWVDAQGKVVSIEEGVRPDTFPRTFEPTVPARFVIETNAHFMNSFDVRVGATVEIPKDILPEDLRK